MKLGVKGLQGPTIVGPALTVQGRYSGLTRLFAPTPDDGERVLRAALVPGFFVEPAIGKQALEFRVVGVV